MPKELLLEIGTEEIPAGFIPGALKEIETLAQKSLKEQRIGFGRIKTLGTPRRLVLFVEDVEEKQKSIFKEIIGPPIKVAFDAEGNHKKAALGFAKSQGVDISRLQTISTPKGEYLGVRKEEPAEDTRKILSSILPEIITSLSFPKSMRWADLDLYFVRPIHWILAIFASRVIPFKLGNIDASNSSQGHFLKSPDMFTVDSFDSYLKKGKNAFVIADQQERKETIRKEISQLAKDRNGTVLLDEDLLETVTYLVEFPIALMGNFDQSYLKLPREVLISSMREHQKYFSVVDKKGNLLPYFIVIGNNPGEDLDQIVRGNERVLKARLADAQFFFQEDRKVPLADRAKNLKNVLFQAQLGTLYEKTLRLEKLAEYLAEKIDPQTEKAVKRAALLCKADLTTQMVGEFPRLQGIMGGEYALLSGEDEKAAIAIYEHYLPTFGNDRLPATTEGTLLGIADRIDTIVGCFGVGVIPTGNTDPYGLRRQALAIITIILKKGFSLSLNALVEKSIEILNEKISRGPEETKAAVQEFFFQRFKNRLTSMGFPYDVVEAAISVTFDDLFDSFKRVEALKTLKTQPEFEPVLIAFKRIANIIDKYTGPETIDPSLFEDTAEQDLYRVGQEIKNLVVPLIEKGDYPAALQKIARLKDPVDTFFDTVLVMAEDEKIRRNRLSLLKEINGLFSKMANFSKMAV